MTGQVPSVCRMPDWREAAMWERDNMKHDGLLRGQLAARPPGDRRG